MHDPNTDSYGGMDFGDEAQKSEATDSKGKPVKARRATPNGSWSSYGRFLNDEKKRRDNSPDMCAIFGKPVTAPVAAQPDGPAYNGISGFNLASASAVGALLIAYPPLADHFHEATQAVGRQIRQWLPELNFS